MIRSREDASLPEVLREYGEIWTGKPKVLLSRNRARAGQRVGTR